MILLYVKCAHCCNTSLAQACGRKPKARKNACPQEGSGDQRAEVICLLFSVKKNLYIFFLPFVLICLNVCPAKEFFATAVQF